MSTLSGEDRALFRLVAEAAVANPWSSRREDLDHAIAGLPGRGTEATRERQRRVERRLSKLEEKGPIRLESLADGDRDLVEHALLWEGFHRRLDQMDEAIRKQEQRPGEPQPVPWVPAMLQDLRRRGLDVERARRMVELCWQMRRAFYFIGRELPGRSQSMRALRESLWRALFTHDLRRYEARLWNRMEDFSILLLGETGTGKGAAAAALGRSGFLPWDERRGTFAWDFGDGFVPVHLTEHPENLFESALFGHRRGAFTGAVADHDGVLARCRPHGVVFLDEIGEVTLPMQVKLLRVLQERTYTPVGSSEPRRFAGRILAATHRSPDELRRSGALRNDFYFRLSTHTIVLPPLRQRIVEEPGELQALVEVIASRIVGAGLGGEIAAVLRRDLGPGYGFPGNVRELEQLVRVVLIEGACRPDRPEGDRGAFWDAARRGEIDAEGFLDQWCAELLGRFGSYVDVARRTGLDRRTVKRRAIRGAQNGQAPAT